MRRLRDAGRAQGHVELLVHGAEWVRLLGTHSDHRILPDEQRRELHAAVGDVIDRHGGRVDVVYDVECYLTSASLRATAGRIRDAERAGNGGGEQRADERADDERPMAPNGHAERERRAERVGQRDRPRGHQREHRADQHTLDRDERRLHDERGSHRGRLEPERAQHADLAAPLAHGAHHDHADPGDADDQPEREVRCASAGRTAAAARAPTLHDAAQRLGLAAVGEEPPANASANAVGSRHVEVRPVRHGARPKRSRRGARPTSDAVVRPRRAC